MLEKRIRWIDISKGIGIILVLMGHVSKIKIINNIIFSFHMPLFFMISGYLYKNKEKFVKNKFKKILIPYFLFSIVSFLYWFIIERHIRSQSINPLYAFSNIFFARGGSDNYIFNVVLWFLPCLFITETIFWILENKFPKKRIGIIVFLSSIIGFIYPKVIEFRLPFCIDIFFTSIVFYYIGYIFKNYIELKTKEKIKNKENIIILIGICLTIFLAIIENGANMDNLRFTYYTVFYIAATVGTYTVYLFSNKLCKFKISSIIEWIGKNSLYIMCIHEPIKRIVIALYSKLIKQNGDIIRQNFLQVIIITLIVTIISAIMSYFINKLKYRLKSI